MILEEVREMSDEDLKALARAVNYELLVRSKIRELTPGGRCKKHTVWGPGPPYYFEACCKFEDGHKGECEPNKTPQECKEIHDETGRQIIEWHAGLRRDAVSRMDKGIGE